MPVYVAVYGDNAGYAVGSNLLLSTHQLLLRVRIFLIIIILLPHHHLLAAVLIIIIYFYYYYYIFFI